MSPWIYKSRSAFQAERGGRHQQQRQHKVNNSSEWVLSAVRPCREKQIIVQKPLFTNCMKSTTFTSQPHSALSASLNYLMSSCLQHTDTQPDGKEWVMCRRRPENEAWCVLWNKSWILSFITLWCEWAVTVLMALRMVGPFSSPGDWCCHGLPGRLRNRGFMDHTVSLGAWRCALQLIRTSFLVSQHDTAFLFDRFNFAESFRVGCMWENLCSVYRQRAAGTCVFWW